MNPSLVELLCDPVTREALALEDEVTDERGAIVSGALVSPSGKRWPIERGVPRFGDPRIAGSVKSFGDEWNHFNFVAFKEHWSQLTVANTFGSTEAFRGRLVVDAGAGSGAQTLWMLESGARHVIALELSHAVDGVIQRNLATSGFTNFDVIQCSIDAPPLRDQSIDGIVICHNVIQHTPSVEDTAHALWSIVGPGGEFVFNCYYRNDESLLRWIRHHVVFGGLRGILRRAPFEAVLGYSYAMGLVRMVPAVGWMAEKSGLCVRGHVPVARTYADGIRNSFRATSLNTFDAFGSHAYHYRSHAELKTLVASLQPDDRKVRNSEAFYSRPPPVGIALRLSR